MAEATKIEWCDHTFNPWVGCTKVSAACDNCYAEGWAKRSGMVQWGDHPRRRTSENYWRQPLKWNRVAKRDGVRRRVFSPVFPMSSTIRSTLGGGLICFV